MSILFNIIFQTVDQITNLFNIIAIADATIAKKLWGDLDMIKTLIEERVLTKTSPPLLPGKDNFHEKYWIFAVPYLAALSKLISQMDLDASATDVDVAGKIISNEFFKLLCFDN